MVIYTGPDLGWWGPWGRAFWWGPFDRNVYRVMVPRPQVVVAGHVYGFLSTRLITDPLYFCMLAYQILGHICLPGRLVILLLLP